MIDSKEVHVLVTDVRSGDSGERVVFVEWWRADEKLPVADDGRKRITDALVVPVEATDDEIVALIREKRAFVLDDWNRNSVKVAPPALPTTALIGFTE